ncbi:MAG: molecular chaperone DnaK, partial [Candidatus Competibacterales bacterium]
RGGRRPPAPARGPPPPGPVRRPPPAGRRPPPPPAAAAAARQGICLLPKGTDAERPVRLDQRRFALRLGQPVQFHLLSSNLDRLHVPGELVALDRDYSPLPPLATVLDAPAETPSPGQAPREQVVVLEAELSELGTLALRCVAADDPQRRWEVEFQLRGGAAGTVLGTKTVHPQFAAAAERVRENYGGRGQGEPRGVKRLRADLDKILGKREGWETPLLRELFGVLWEGARRRRRSADHERLWFNLAGFCLRPGFGYPLDDWRVEQLWTLYPSAVQYGGENQVWAEWWTLWRRVAGGLPPAAQAQLAIDLTALLEPKVKTKSPGGKRGGAAKGKALDDAVALAAVLEHLEPATKVALGGLFLRRLEDRDESLQTWWALGRLGVREPVYGSAHQVVPPEAAAPWLDALLDLDWSRVKTAPLAATLLAQRSFDRQRDLDDQRRRHTAARLVAAKAPPAWIALVEEGRALDEGAQSQLYGEALPPGLALLL